MTDAKLAAGVLDPDYFLGGRLRLHPKLARDALRRLGDGLDLAPTELANGIIRLVNANMISALKLVSVRRGHDPRDFVLVAAGGGGAMHAAALGAELQVKRVVVPPHSGVFSAWGMGLAEARADAAQTRVLEASTSTAPELDAVFTELEREVTAALVAEGADAGSAASSDRPTCATAARNTQCACRSRAGGLGRDRRGGLPRPPPEEVHLRSRGRPGRDRHLPRLRLRRARAGAVPASPDGTATPAAKGRRRVDFDADGVHEAVVFDRRVLPVGFEAPGPVVVEDETTTALVHPGQTLEVDEAANLVVWLG